MDSTFHVPLSWSAVGDVGLPDPEQLGTKNADRQAARKKDAAPAFSFLGFTFLFLRPDLQGA